MVHALKIAASRSDWNGQVSQGNPFLTGPPKREISSAVNFFDVLDDCRGLKELIATRNFKILVSENRRKNFKVTTTVMKWISMAF